MKIVIITGSPRRESLTARVGKYIGQQLRETTGHEIELINMHEWELPFVQQVIRKAADAPAFMQPIAKAMLTADAFVLVSPEFNGSYAPSLKNLLDHFPKQQHKPFGLVTASPGALGGIRAAQQLLMLVPALFGIASPHLLVVPAVDKKFDAQGRLLDPSFEPTVNQFIKEFLWLAERIVVNSTEPVLN